MLRTIVTVFVSLLFIGLLVFGVWYLINLYSWPIWIGALIVSGTIGTILALILLRRYFLRNNERKFVERVIAQEGSAIFASGKDNQLLIDDLENQWEKSIKTLYGSKLSKGKNPIYALPWILVVGESGAGKTSLIKNSRLSSALTDVEETAQYSGTKNCDWWFFEDAIILDTAGRYTIPIDDTRDNAEWERFLSLLSKYRKKEPLNGMIVAISAERLLENDKDLIQADALNIRKRINQLMASIGAKFPVYVMVTKMDKIYGFTDFCNALPQEHQTQAMGYMNESLNPHWDEVLDDGIYQIESKIRSLELLMIEKGNQGIKELLLFSQEFDLLTPALKDFSQIVFGDNPYQKIPMLRGIYFSSALSDGESSSQFLSEFNLPQTSKKADNRAYFVSDFFKTILPNDRNIFTPIKEYLGWQRRNYTIAVLAWILVFSSIVGTYSYSYMQNIEVIGNIEYIQKHKSNFKDKDLTTRIILLDKLRLDINKIDNLNKDVLLSSVSFKQSQKAENNLKKLFLENFNDDVLQEFVFKMDRSIKKIDNKTSSREVVSYIVFIMDSIDILEQVLGNKREIEINKNLYTFTQEILFAEENSVEPSVSLLFTNSYIAFLKWSDDKNLIKEQIQVLKSKLALIVDKKGKNLYWLTDEGVSLIPSITIENFWQGIDVKLAENSPTISGSLTLKGRDNLIKNIDMIKEMMGDSKELEKNLTLFWKWYDERFYYRWRNFALSFKDGEKFLDSNINTQSTLYSMTSDINPYFSFIQAMAKEFKAYKSLGKTPSWTKLVIELDNIMNIATNIRNSKDSLLAKVSKEKDQIIAKAEASLDKKLDIKHIKSAMLLNKYIDDLTKLSVVVDKKKSQLLISDFFNDSPDEKAPSPSYAECQNHYSKFKHSNSYYANSNFIYEIVEGPKNYIINYSIKNMNSILNDQWENKVLGSVPLSSDENILKSLFNKQKGLVWQYVDQDLKPFVILNQYGYKVKTVSGFKLDIEQPFIRYINSGINLLSVYKPQYSVNITTLPFDTNQEAKVEANYVTLRLICAKDDFILENNNYKLSKNFDWSPSTCGDTILSFGFNDFEVTKTYKGANGFLYFLSDFKDGTQKFTIKDFDSEVPELKQYSIKWIKLIYNISGEGSMLKLLDKTPYEIPKKVTGSR
ncbi:MAG: hypothetical protein DRG78_19020 [Epsilonproteobacteria bacterium]|nr:MAG: hypothetical protein DRG78_19020 [Campylobacterota bacterium]